jgi:uncharacterized repeat protein (TIGR03803 family)
MSEMKRLRLDDYALSAGVAIALLAGCGGAQPPISAPGAMPRSAMFVVQSPNDGFKVVYNFNPESGPNGGLLPINNKLYGTTTFGGAQGDGTIFEASTSGEERTLHSFQGNPDGAFPWSTPVSLNGKLYGTTYYGGEGFGTVFETSAAGAERILFNFHGDADGAYPYGGVVTNETGNLFVATFGGGQYGKGAVVRLTTAGHATLLHSFGNFSSSGDGTEPEAALTSVDGALYGTTYEGGTYGHGTVYEIMKSGGYRVLYSFGAGSGDGGGPSAPLIYVNGTFYGTTEYGGTRGNAGTVYAISTSGAEHVVYRFQGKSGEEPAGGLLYIHGLLFGTTSTGGSYQAGTLFKLTTSGEETVIHSFNNTDGEHPGCTLVEVNGALYGTTTGGGSHGGGTIFRVYL